MQNSAYKEAVRVRGDGKPPTAGQVREVVDRWLSEEDDEEPIPLEEEPEIVEQPVTDALGAAIDDPAIAA